MREVTACGGLSTAPLDGLQPAARRISSVASAAGAQVSSRTPDLPHVMRRQDCQPLLRVVRRLPGALD